MIRKTFLAVAAVLSISAADIAPARADVDIDINLGYGGFYGTRISCRTGARIVAHRFRDVRVVECAGSYFEYRGRRNGKRYWIKVSSNSGRIVAVRRVF